MYKLTFLEDARKDIQNIVDYYDLINPILSDAFLNEIEKTVNFIQLSPEACSKRLKNIRVSFVKRFRFGVYFKLMDKNITIIAILHTSQNPQIWKNR